MSSPDTSEERMLVTACQRGDRQALQEVIRRFQRPVYATSYRILGNTAEAEENTQDTFLKVIDKIAGFRLDSSLSTWIYRIAINTALNRRQTWQRKVKLLDTGIPVECRPDPTAPAPDRQAEQQQLLNLVQEKMAALPEEQRLVLILGDIQGLDYGEIAAVLKIPLGTAKSRLHRARTSLRDMLIDKLTPASGGPK